MAYPETGGIPVDETGAPGALVTSPGQVQFGPMLLGSGTPAGWRNIVGWRDHPQAQIGDAPRPQGHGASPGTVFADAAVVTFTFLLRGTPEAKLLALDAIERWTPMDGVERPLVVNDGAGPWLRNARVIGRNVPQEVHFRHAPIECSIQWVCADPFRYSLTERLGSGSLSGGSGGLTYPLTYPLTYGVPASGSFSVANDGGVPAPFVATFAGPLTNPSIVGPDWILGFGITLVEGETLVVDTAAGTAFLNGDSSADRLTTITTTSDPVDVCRIPVGVSTLSLAAESGTGTVQVSYHDTRM
ncbi:hypothetical protein ACJ5H2_13610 [Nocardioides sp. R1-1]|uniref:hypothetical protein n=1 Tax=Nocardioides sp. R1-1 TaxID=3383502 RepID=UPI0038CF9887